MGRGANSWIFVYAGDPDQNRHAVDMILQKIVEDPQSGSCPNISYADYKGPVASSNPTGSPFANTMQMGQGFNGQIGQNFNGGTVGNIGNIGNSMNNLNLNSGGNTNVNNPVVENLKTTLRGSGYSEQATEEIAAAMYTLANYGFLGLGLGLGINIGSNLGNLGSAGGGGGGGAGMNMGNQGAQGNPTPNAGSLANLIGMLGSGNSGNSSGSLLGGSTNNTVADNNASVFGPVGSTTTTMAGGDTGEGSGAFFSTAGGMGGDRYSGAGDSMFGNSYNSGFGGGSTFGGTNQNSFGLGTSMGTAVGSFGETGSNDDESTVKEVEVGEHIVGAILGPKGKGIVELQKYTNTNIQISRKGVFAPGTRNRVVTIKGAAQNVQKAAFLIQQRLSQEESKRARQGTASTP